MKKANISWQDIGVRAQFSFFAPQGKGGELHAILHIENPCSGSPSNDTNLCSGSHSNNAGLCSGSDALRPTSFPSQLHRLLEAEHRLLEACPIPGARKVFKRIFLSDIANQAPLIPEDNACPVSLIQQPPLDGTKIAMWLYLSSCNGYEQLWTASMTSPKETSYEQTQQVLQDYEQILADNGMTIERDCLRTWFYVRDVDTQYKGLVIARKENFTQQGMTADTHYLASTGIEGTPFSINATPLIALDTYAVKGLQPGQQHYLYAPTHLNPTSEYGVTFERGTAIQYGDRRHLLISGTASIDNKGQVVHVGDAERQTLRMWENVETLLSEGGASFDDVAHIIVYLRDIADYPLVSRMFADRFPDTPYVITLAPVCRPAWLIEMECMAVTPHNDSRFNDF